MTNDWRGRVSEELVLLQTRLRALNTFAVSAAFAELPERSRRLLQRQRAVMILYEDVLQERLLPLPGDG